MAHYPPLRQASPGVPMVSPFLHVFSSPTLSLSPLFPSAAWAIRFLYVPVNGAAHRFRAGTAGCLLGWLWNDPLSGSESRCWFNLVPTDSCGLMKNSQVEASRADTAAFYLGDLGQVVWFLCSLENKITLTLQDRCKQLMRSLTALIKLSISSMPWRLQSNFTSLDHLEGGR